MKVALSCPTLCDPVDDTGRQILQARILEWVAYPFSRGSSQPGVEPRSPALQADSLPAEPPWKPKNTGVGNLSLLQRIFLTWESNWGFLHCRWILYQLSHQGIPSNGLHTLQIMFKIVRLQYCHFEWKKNFFLIHIHLSLWSVGTGSLWSRRLVLEPRALKMLKGFTET